MSKQAWRTEHIACKHVNVSGLLNPVRRVIDNRVDVLVNRHYLAGHGLAVVVEQVPLLLAILGLDIRGLSRLSAVQRDLYVGRLAKTEETLHGRIRKH